MRILASSLIGRFSGAVCHSRTIHSQHQEAEFPASSQTACRLLEGPLGLWSAGCASTDALRSLNNWVNLKDQYEISFLRETLAFAWWLPPKGRSRPQSASTGNACRESSKDVLATGSCILQRQRQIRRETGEAVAQRIAFARFRAATDTARTSVA